MDRTLEQELLGRLEKWLPAVGPIGRDTPLIQSGLLDSLALFNVAMWVEEQMGDPIDVTTVDLPTEWNTVAGIISFIQNRRSRPAAS